MGKINTILNVGSNIGKGIMKAGKIGLGAAKLGYKALKLGVKGGVGAAKLGYKATKLGVKGGIGAAKLGYKAATKGYQLGSQGARKIGQGYSYLKQKIPELKNSLDKKMNDASKAFRRMIHSQELLTIGQIIDSQKSDSYKVFLIKKYINELKRENVVPKHIVQQIQKQLLKKVLSMHLTQSFLPPPSTIIDSKPPNIRMTESFMIPEQTLKTTTRKSKRKSKR